MGADVSVFQRASAGARGGPIEAQYPCFDGIRAIAALMVVVYHAVFFSAGFRTLGGTYFGNLNAGVWIFFVTSGFLLYRPFAAGHRAGTSGPNVRGYAVRRFARIYPAYWAVLAFFTFVVPRAQLPGAGTALRHITLTQTYWGEKNPFLIGLPPAWSLVVEMTFYAFLPLYAMAVYALARRRRAITVELMGCGVLVALGLAAIISIAAGVGWLWLTILPQHLAAFALGMLLAVAVSYADDAKLRARLDGLGRAAWMWWAGALAFFIAIPLVFRIGWVPPDHSARLVALNVCETLLGLCIVVPAVLGPQDRGVIRRVLRSRLLVFLGTISYGIYIWHWFLLLIVQNDWLHWTQGKGNWATLFVLTLPVVIVAAAASWYLLERPILRVVRTIAR